MKAMILAAGRGKRMRPLSDFCPKPLLQINGKPLLQYHIEALQRAAINELVINTHWLAEQIHAFCGDGSRFGVQIQYSDEAPDALETAGGIARALPMLGEQFIVVNGDIFSDFEFKNWRNIKLSAEHPAHLLLVDNPPHHREGDFGITEAWLSHDLPRWTFAGIGVYHASLFAGFESEAVEPLGPMLHRSCGQQSISAEYYSGLWADVGSPERLQQMQG